MKRKSKKLLLILLITILSAILLFGGVVTYAYFSTVGYVVTEDGDKQIAKIGMNISLLFDRLDPAKVTDANTILTEADKTEVKFNSTAEWGTKENPYIISDIRHLQNLSVLQGIGYFDELYIKKNYTDPENHTGYNEGSMNMPYFLVCNPDGTPATIDGKEITFAPIGSDEYPFIGYVGGAFTEGTTDVGGKSSPVSALTNIQVVTTEDQPDVGLFGYIGFLGDEPNDDTTTTFKGQISTVRDLVLSDVTVTVRVETWAEALTKALHRFSFDKVSDADLEKVPHENHHIGILAGHVEYTQVEYISVYYSNDEQIAIDLQHTAKSTSGDTANYMSISGIIGFVYNMNPEVTAEGIGVGSGTNNSDLDISTGGAGSGGGLASGTGRGYVTAEGIYEKYKPTSTDVGNQTVYMYYDAELKPNNGILLQKKDNKYTLEDGTTPVTITNGAAKFGDSAGNEYQTENYFVKVVTTDADGKETAQYYLKDETTPVTRFQATKMLLIGAKDEQGNALCTRYYRKRLIPFFPDEATDNYYFYDGVFTFALSSTSDHIASTWVNDEPDSFTLGAADSQFVTKPYKDNKAIVGFVKQLSSNAELNAAINENKKLFIMFDLGDNNNFVMSLYSQSTPNTDTNPEKKFFTKGVTIPFDSELRSNVLKWDEDHTITLSDEIRTGINNKTIQVMNLGLASTQESLSDINQKYNVTAAAVKAQNGQSVYSYFYDSGTPVSITENQTQIKDFYNYQGYFYYIEQDEFLRTTYAYYYQPADDANGNPQEPILLSDDFVRNAPTTGSNWNPAFFTPSGDADINGEVVYTREGTTYKGVLVNYTKKTFQSGESASLSGGIATKELNTPYYFFYADPDGTAYYSGGGNAVQLSSLAATTKTTGGQQLYKSQDGREGLLLHRYPVYRLFNGDKTLRIMSLSYQRTILGFIPIDMGTYYPIWNGSNAESQKADNFPLNNNYTVTPNSNTDCTIVFSTDGTCYIKYAYGNEVRYVNYDSSNEGIFNGSSNNVSSTTKMKIYAVEGTQEVAYGRVQFGPAEEDKTLEFKADEFILWPTSTMTGTAVQNAGGMSPDPTYTIKQLEASIGKNNENLHVPAEDVLTQQAGWKNHNGEMLTMADLHKKFSLGAGIAGTDYTFSIFGGSLSIGENQNNMIVAPVGTLGVEADIPIGCVAFRINKTGTSKIRVIVAVPQTDFYYGEDGNTLNYKEDYYFALWNKDAAGENFFTSFNLSQAIEVFELPRSNPYKPGTTPDGELAANVSKYINVTHNGEEYRCYLNGDRVLVGYEFTVQDAGVYIMGCTKPMEIVYFSADGTASAGRDGSSGSKLGTIDFVYDHENNIVPVTEASGDTGATEDFSKYYASLCILRTDNGYGGEGNYPNINDLQILIRRSAEQEVGSSITYQVRSTDVNNCNLAEVLRYSISADKVTRKENATRPPA